MTMKSGSEFLGGAVWPDDPTEAGVPGVDATKRVPTLNPATGIVKWEEAGAAVGHWEPVTNGDPDSPEIVFSGGDLVMTFVED